MIEPGSKVWRRVVLGADCADESHSALVIYAGFVQAVVPGTTGPNWKTCTDEALVVLVEAINGQRHPRGQWFTDVAPRRCWSENFDRLPKELR